MALTPGTRLGAYEILGPLGAGGMGEVYKARDGRLDRAVAVKVLPAHVASDPTLRQRFEREAKALAALSDPHICAIFDVGRTSSSEGDIDYLVMEHLEGETLSSRLAKGPLSQQDTVKYGVQIADALDKAHRKGVVHRDLKPGNIMLTAGGAKLLDFGLARMEASSQSVRDLSAAPTAASPLTGVGSIVGTFQYMSPEQIEGQEADTRSDIFAFGAVLYEMATGRKAFDGKTQASLVAAILEREPAPLSTAQPTSPPALDQLIRTCLAKNPDDRWQSAGDIGRQLRWMTESGSQSSTTASAPSPQVRTRSGSSRTPVVAAAVVVVALLAAGARMFNRPEPDASLTVTRFVMAPAADAPLVNVGGIDVIISPDGTRVVYLGDRPQGGRALYLRELGGLEPRMIPGTELPGDFVNANPFFSWDGTSIGFRSPGQGIMRVPVSGGAPLKIADDEQGFVGAAWGPDGRLVAALVRGGADNGLYTVSAGGGAFERLTREGREGVVYVAPSLLPGGNAVLVEQITLQPPMSRVAVVDLDDGEERIVLEQGANPMHLSSGHLVFGRGTTLMAVPFNASAATVEGTPAPVIQDVRHPGLVTATDYSLSRNGTLIYVPADVSTSGTVAPVWVTRDGRDAGSAISAPLDNPRELRLSPDGRRLAVTTGAIADSDVWVYDLEGRPPLPLVERGNNRAPIWGLDGQHVYFTSDRGGGLWGVYSVAADGSSQEPQLVPTGNLAATPSLAALTLRPPLTWLPDGRLVFAMNNAAGGGADLLAVPPTGSDSPDEILATMYGEDSAVISPDGRWLAYRSTRTGRNEIWVMGVDGTAPVRVSENGGQEPVWSRDGSELYYLEGSRMMAIQVDTGAAFAFRPASVLFDRPFYHVDTTSIASGLAIRSYDVGPDGRFLMIPISERAEAGSPAPPSNIVVVQNWMAELRQVVPVN